MLLLLVHCRDKEAAYTRVFPETREAPASLKTEHDSLLSRMRRIRTGGDSAGAVSKKLLDLMEHHFGEEEELVFPALKILPSLAADETPENKEALIQLSVRFRSQLAHMSAEHQLIRAHLKELIQLADSAQRSVISALAGDIDRHALAEEEIHFPAAILVGEYLKLTVHEGDAPHAN